MTKEEFDQVFDGVVGQDHIVQNREELWWLVQQVQEISPKKILDVGTAHGGTLRFWQELAEHTYSIDPNSGQFQVKFHPNRPPPILLIGKSQSKEIIAAVKEHAPFDFCFIDGDHAYESCKQDWENYSPMVRPGGLVGFHDVGESNFVETCGQVFNEISFPDKRHFHRLMGIGLVRIPE